METETTLKLAYVNQYEKAVFSENWEEIYIIYDKRLKLFNPFFETNTASKDICEYIF